MGRLIENKIKGDNSPFILDVKFIKCRRKGYNSMLGIDENTRRKDTKRIS